MKPSFASRATPATVRPKPDAWIEGIRNAESPLVRDFREKVTAAGLGHTLLPAPVAGNPYLIERYEALQCALTQPAVATCEFPATLDSVGNRKDISVAAMHARRVSVKAKRALGERIAQRFRADRPNLFAPSTFFVVVVLTRIAPRALDSDNLESSLKAVRDGVASGLGVSDASPLVRYVVSQQRGGVRVHAVRASLHISPKGEAQT